MKHRLTPSQARTLRLLTKNGQLQSFATSLVEDAQSRALRSLVDSGFLTYEYTGTQRVYTLTEACSSQFPVRREGKTVAKKKVKEATNGQAEEAPRDTKPADTPAEDTTQSKAPALRSGERKVKKKKLDESAPAAIMNGDEPPPVRTRSKPPEIHADLPTPTLADLLAVGEIAAQHGGAKKLLGVVALVDDLARKVGGIDRLRGALEGLETLAKLFK
jgi:hypothetical protein